MRPIDADAFEAYLIKARENTYANEIHDCEDESQMTNINDELYYSTQSFIDVMRYRPTLNIEPAMDGYWIPVLADYTLAMMGYDPEEEDYIYRCSICEHEDHEASNCCPNCGYKMRGILYEFD